MNESGFTQYLLKKIRPSGVYAWKIQAVANNGIPDCYFSGVKGDLWAEMKWLNDLPKKDTTIIEPKLSELQRRWLNDRHKEGRNVYVVLGSPIGCYIFHDKTWNQGITRNHLKLSRADVIEWIIHQTNG